MPKHNRYYIKNCVNTYDKNREKIMRNICYFEYGCSKDRGSNMIVLSNRCYGFRIVLTNVKLLH